MSLTRSQRVAQAAFAAVSVRTRDETDRKKYLSFARAFPTLIHTCGLAQATAFALAKQGVPLLVLNDLARVVKGEDGAIFQKRARGEIVAGPATSSSSSSDLTEYLGLSRDALTAATWIKRYAEALFAGEDPE